MFCQVTLNLVSGLALYHDLFFAVLLQTWCQVTFSTEVNVKSIIMYMASAIIVSANNGLFSDEDDDEGDPNGTSSKSSSLKPLILSIFLMVLHVIVFIPVHTVHACLFEHHGLNLIRPINYINHAYFFLNVLSIWLIIRNHKLK